MEEALNSLPSCNGVNSGSQGFQREYSGTTDILDDFDCGYTARPISEDKVDGSKVVEFENIKRRGNVALSVAYSYALERNIPYNELLLSVQMINPDELLPIKQAANQARDADVITAVEACIFEGINTKMKMAQDSAKRSGASQRFSLSAHRHPPRRLLPFRRRRG